MIDSADILHGRILIVDDQESNILLLAQMLLGAGYDSVASTTDPSRVCELHLVNHYDLILLDLLMPEMDGFQVMENLKGIETGGYLPVLVITAQPNHKMRALKAGARDFVTKPFDLAEVLIRVHNLLEVRLLYEETRRLYARVATEQKASERLLHDALPRTIVERLLARRDAPDERAPGLVTESFADLTVLFADLFEFTKFAEGASAEVLVGVLNELSTRFGRTDGRPAFDPSGTIDDAYVAAAGLPGPVGARTILASRKALDMIEALDRFNALSPYQLSVRIGTRTREDRDAILHAL